MPGTGGTFVSTAIETVFERSAIGARRPAPIALNKHGTCREIPEEHAHLPIISNVRNPLDRYVALYEYSWWRKREMPGISRREIQEIYPKYPDITFAQFVDLASRHFTVIKTEQLAQEDRPGFLSEQFARFYFRDPKAALANFSREYVNAGRHRDDMFNVTFLHNHRLTDDLCDFLESIGFDAEDSSAVRALGRVNPQRVRLSPLDFFRRNTPRRTTRDWRDYYTPELIELVRSREWFLFAVFPELDVSPS